MLRKILREIVILGGALALLSGIAYAATLSLGDPFTTGETITASKFNNKFTAISTLINGGIESDNIADLSLTGADIAENSVNGSKILDNTIVATKYGGLSIPTAAIQADAVTAAKIPDAGLTKAELAVNTVTQTYMDEEGTWSAGTCTPVGVPDTGSKPTSNPNLRVSVTADTTDEYFIASVTFFVDCAGGCGVNRTVLATCNYNSVEDDAYALMVMEFNSLRQPMTYQNRYQGVTGGAKNIDCYIWDGANNPQANYCARLIVTHHKR